MLKKEQQMVKRGLLIGLGLAAYTKQKGEKFAGELVRKGHLNPAEGKRLVKTIYQEADLSRKKITKVIEDELKRLFLVAAPPAKKAKRKKK